MEPLIRTTRSTEETFALGVALGRVLEPHDFVGLTGQLGAGKTLFSRGVAQGAGVPLEDVSSPTYSIIQTYEGRIALHHADLYRLVSDADLYATGYFDVIESGGACLVEWFEKIPSATPPDSVRISIEVIDETERRFTISAHGPRSQALRTRWLTAP